MLKIGYQGAKGSNSETAAQSMLLKLKIIDYHLVPLMSSVNVIGELKREEVDYGVVAIKNNVGGIAEETFDALRDEDLELVIADTLYIDHSLFKKSKDIDNQSIVKVISHIQALKQCSENLQKLFPNAKLEAIEDTAIGASYLASGEYGDDTAALCKQSAGHLHGLYLEQDSMQDDPKNRTEFKMFRNPIYPNTLMERISLYTDNGQGGLGYYVTQESIIAYIFFLTFAVGL